MTKPPEPPQSSRPSPISSNDELVLGTINAPYTRCISAEELAHALAAAEVEAWLTHVHGFLFEVRPKLIRRFAEQHGISHTALDAAYRQVMQLTGESPRPELDAALGLPEPPGP